MRILIWKLIIIAIIITTISSWNSIAFADEWFSLSNEYVSWIQVPKTDNTDNSNPEALYIIIKVINRILSLTSVIAIIIFLIGGYKVLTANWDDSKAKWWYKIIKNAIIWLLIIWLTRAIVRLIFRLVWWLDWDHDFYIWTG